MESGEQPVISASELGEFTFCHTAWWLDRVQGLPSTNQAGLAQGRALHEGHGRRARRAVRLRAAAGWLLLLAAASIGAGLYLLLAG